MLLQRQRPREVLEKSDPPLLFSHSEDSAAECFCCGRTFFLKALGGKRGHGTRSVNSLHFPREEFSKGHSAHSHTNLHWSALSTVVYAPGVLPRNPAINQPTAWIQHQEQKKASLIWTQYSNKSCSRSVFPDASLCAVRHRLLFPSPSLVRIWCRSKRSTFHKESVCESQRSLESPDKINRESRRINSTWHVFSQSVFQRCGAICLINTSVLTS